MSTFHLAVILTRFAGFYVLMTYALPSLIQHGLNGWRVWQASQSAMVPGAGMSGSQWLTDLLYPALYVTVGLAMILKATKFARVMCAGCFPDGSCQRCGYNLAAGGLARCPECGHEEPGPAGPA